MRGRRCWLALWCWHRDCIFKPLPLSLIPGRHEEESKTDTRVTNMSWARRWHSGQRLRRAPRYTFLGCCARGVNEGRRSPAYYHERDIEMAVHGQGVSLLGLGQGALKRAKSESDNVSAKSDSDKQSSASAERKCTRKERVLCNKKTALLASAALWAQGATICDGRLASDPASPSMRRCCLYRNVAQAQVYFQNSDRRIGAA